MAPRQNATTTIMRQASTRRMPELGYQVPNWVLGVVWTAAWWTLVLQASAGGSWLWCGLGLLSALMCLPGTAKSTGKAMGLALLAAFLIDGVASVSGAITYHGRLLLTEGPPLWILGLWLWFAGAWQRLGAHREQAIPILLGLTLIGAPLAYFGGHRLGALQIETAFIPSLVVIGLAYGLAMIAIHGLLQWRSNDV